MLHLEDKKRSWGKLLTSLLVVVVFVVLFGVLKVEKVEAVTSSVINFQGKIVNKTTRTNLVAGTPACVAVGADTCDFRVRIYSDPAAGTLLFSETHSNVEIGDTNGVFNLAINSVCNNWASCGGGAGITWGVDSTIYIEIAFDPSGNADFAEGENFARKLLYSVPFASEVDTLGGIGSNGFVQLSPSSIQTITTATNPLIHTTNTIFDHLVSIEVGGVETLRVTSYGTIILGSGTPLNAFVNLGASTASNPHINLTAGADPTLATGNLWWNGSALNFYTGSSTVNILTTNTTLFTYNGAGLTYLTNTTSDFTVGGNTVANSAFAVDTNGAHTVKIGSGSGSFDGRLELRVFNGTSTFSGLLLVATNDNLYSAGADMFFGQTAESLATFNPDGNDLYVEGDTGVGGTIYVNGNILADDNLAGSAGAWTGSNIGTNINAYSNMYAANYFGKDVAISGYDLAEEYEVDDPTIGPGDVVKFKKDSTQLVVERAGGADKAYDDEAVGVISTDPGLYLKDWEANKENGRPVALAGRVPVKVTIENGGIRRGDYLTSSSRGGYAMKASRSGYIIGRAMEDFGTNEENPSTEVEGIITMYVDLGYVNDAVFNRRAGIIGSLTIEDFAMTNGEKFFEVIEGSEGIKLIGAGEVTSSTVGVNVISAKDIDDMVVRLANGKGLKIVDHSESMILGVSDKGKLNLKEDEGSSVGSAQIAIGETAVFVNHSGITDKSRIFITLSESIDYKVIERQPGQGFKVEIIESSANNIQINYFVVN